MQLGWEQLQLFGEWHFNTHLKQSDIKELRNSKKSNSDLAMKFKVDSSTIRKIRNNKTWKQKILEDTLQEI
jgi:hypothetical protein